MEPPLAQGHHGRPLSIQPHHRNRAPTPASMSGNLEEGNNKRYLNVPDFHGDHKDRDIWEEWKMHLKSKFRNNTVLFQTEWNKIDYIQDHYKTTAFNVIKIRANPDHINLYISHKEALHDLDNMFAVFDKESKADHDLHDSKFPMAVKNNKETFD